MYANERGPKRSQDFQAVTAMKDPQFMKFMKLASGEVLNTDRPSSTRGVKNFKPSESKFSKKQSEDKNTFLDNPTLHKSQHSYFKPTNNSTIASTGDQSNRKMGHAPNSGQTIGNNRSKGQWTGKRG
jgi:hypothetical protein